MAVAVAATTQCPYCIDIHTNNARKAGATEAELAEACIVAAALRAGASITHSTHALSE
jgi:AhpD family alkylhydroperoxidase